MGDFKLVLPGAAVILVLSVFYAGFPTFTPVEAIIYGLKAAVLAVVIGAVLRIGPRALGTALLAILRFKAGMIPTLAISALAGAALHYARALTP